MPFLLLFISLALSVSAHAAVQMPKGFRWCVSSSGHQIEGNNTASDWWQWEQAAGRVRSGSAVDHFQRVDEDQALLSDLGVSDARLSIEWSRIEPREGVIDRAAIAHYRREIDGLLARGIRPLITLQHFTLPQWVRVHGGFEWSRMPEAFARFSLLVYREIAPTGVDWLTINEPTISVMFGYLQGVHPPGEKRSFRDVLPVLKSMAAAHAAAYHALHNEAKRKGSNIRVTMVHHLRTMDPWSSLNPMDHMITSVGHEAFNWGMIDALETGFLKLEVPGMISFEEEVPGLRGTQDFLAINYYSGDLLSFSFMNGFEQHSREQATKSDIGWDIYPEGLTRLLIEASERYPSRSIMITENGVADSNDLLRAQFLRDHIAAVSAAMAAGARIEGYCHWTLLDAFEWNEGFVPRFGLYSVDPATFERRARPSAHVYREMIRNNGF
jgi:beta-glucosidase